MYTRRKSILLNLEASIQNLPIEVSPYVLQTYLFSLFLEKMYETQEDPLQVVVSMLTSYSIN